MHDLKLENQLIHKLGFQRKWFTDKSGYWLIYSFKMLKFKGELIVETDKKKLYIDLWGNGIFSNPTTQNYRYSKSNIFKLFKHVSK